LLGFKLGQWEEEVVPEEWINERVEVDKVLLDGAFFTYVLNFPFIDLIGQERQDLLLTQHCVSLTLSLYLFHHLR
jgi:hypothetical protein